MLKRIKGQAGRLLGGLVMLLAAGSALAQTPVASSGVPSSSFLGEQFCFDTNLSNTGAPGYGPYLRLVIPATLSFDSAQIFNSAVTVVSNQVSTGTPLVDPLIIAPTPNTVSVPTGSRLLILRLPVGSITAGGPPLETTICLTIQPGAAVGTPIPVQITPVYQFGDTPTGANGSIIGATPPQTVTPTVIEFEKTNTAPESERPPGAIWPYQYVLTANIANTAVINPLVISDVLPADVQYVGPVTITGGNGCSVTSTPSTTLPGGTVTVTCTGPTTGTTSATDVVVRVPVHIVDTLDEGTCSTETQINNASATATYVPGVGASQVLPVLNDVSEVVAKHVAVQKGVAPATGDPGTVVTYTLNFQTTQFGITDALSILDTLPDGIDFTTHVSLTVGGTPVTIAPTVVPGVNDTVAYDIRAALAADIPAGTAITLVYRGTVRQLYKAAGFAPVLAADTLTNTVVATYSLTANAGNCTDGSAATFVVEPVNIVKRLLTPGPFVPGQYVTFRLSMDIPSGDTQNVVFRDFFPLPVFDVSTMNLAYNGPDIFRAVGGPGADTMTLTPAVSIDTATNALILTYPNINTESPQTVAVDVRVQVQPRAFANNLFLTNIFRATSSNTANEETAENAPVQINVLAPALRLTKGVLSTTGNGTPNPGTGTPVNTNLTGADGNDSVTFRVTIENIGGAPAYDVVVTDPVVTGLNGCVVSSAALASGGALTTTGVDLASGITLGNGAPGNAVLAPSDGSPGTSFGADTAYVGITCTIAPTVAPATVLTNLARATWKPQPLGTPNVQTFPPVSDTATVTIALPGIVKSIAATSEAGTTGTDVAIGEIVRYRLQVAVPEGTTTDFRVRDNIPTGMIFVAGATVRATLVSNGGLSTGVAGIPTVANLAAAATPLTFTLPATAIAGGAGAATTTDCAAPGSQPAASGIPVCFLFGTVSNTDNDNDAEYIVIEFNARVMNIGTNQAGGVRNNLARVGTGATALASTPNVPVTVREPNVAITKTVTQTRADAGDVLNYTINVTNTGANVIAAHDIVLTDVLDPRLALDLGNIVVNLTNASGLTNNSSGNTIQLSVDTLLPNGTIQVTYNATVQNTAAPGTSIPNVVNATFTSLPGATGTGGNPTGTDAFTAGGSQGERTGADGVGGALNDYAVRANVSIPIDAVTLSKTLTASSLPFTGTTRVRPAVEDLTIGEVADFSITATIPEGTVPTLVITDVMPIANGTMEMLEVTSITASAGLTIGTMPAIGTVNVFDEQLGDGINDTARLNFGQVVNPPSAAPPRTITVTVRGRLRDVATNSNGDQLTNTATVSFGSGTDGVATAPIDVVEPQLNIVKASPTTTGQAGDTLNFTVTVSHNGASNADARAVLLTDVLPSPNGLSNLVYGSAVTSGTCVPAPVVSNAGTSGTQLSVAVDQLPLGCSLTVTYAATLQNDVQVGANVVNTANLGWSSIGPGFADSGFDRDYTNSATHTVQISSPGVLKSVTATSATSTGDAQLTPGLPDLTIGEEVTYEFAVVLPAGVSPNAVAVDQLPTGTVSMQVLSSSIVSVGSGISGAPPAGTAGVASDGADTDGFDDRVQWNLGTLTASPAASPVNRTLVFRVVARVMDTAQSVGGVTVRNTASFTTDTAGTITGSADVDIVQPRLLLDKAITSPTAPVFVQAGAVISYQLVLSHATGGPAAASAADAFNVVISDTLPNPGVSFNVASLGGTCPGVTVNAATYPLVTFSLPTLPLATASCTITYTGTVTNTVTPSTTYTNSAVAEYDSLPTAVPGATRHGTTGVVSDEFTIIGPSLVKLTVSSDLAGTTSNVGNTSLFDLAIGETVTYELTIGFPEGTITNAVLVDQLPIGAAGVLEVIGGNIIGLGNAGIVTSNPGTPVFSDRAPVDARNDTTTFDFGTISNPSNGNLADDFIQVQVIARVVNVPQNIDGLVLTNNAVFTTGTTTPVTDDASVEVVEPEMGIVKTMGPVVGGVVTINVALTNSGNAPAHTIVIEDVLNDATWVTGSVLPLNIPAGYLLTTVPGPGAGDTTVRISTAPSAVLPNGSIAAGATLNASFTAQLVSVPPPTNPVLNTATNTGAASYPGVTNPDRREYDDVEDDASLALPAPVVRKTWTSIDTDGSGNVSPGDTIVFAIVVDNTAGGAALTGIELNDEVPANTTFNTAASAAGWTGCVNGAVPGTLCSIEIADVAAGASSTTLFAVVIDSPLPAGVTSVANQAFLTASELPPTPIPSDDPTPPGDEDPTVVPIVSSPVLNITKLDNVADGDDIAPGEVIVYTLTFENTGNQAATNVVLSDVVPVGTTYNAAASAPNVWTCVPGPAAGSACSLNIGNLAVGVPTTRTFAVTVNDPVPAGLALIDNTASIADDRGNTDQDSETTPLNALPGLHISKDDGNITSQPGGVVPYVLRYWNDGDQDASGVVITETVPLHSTFNAAASSPGWSCPDASPAGTSCTRLPITLPGQTPAASAATVTFAVTVVNPLPAGVDAITNTVGIADDAGGTDSDSDDTPVTATPDLVMTKTDGGISSTPGGVIVWTLAYQNVGNQDATSVTITEVVPANTTFNAGSSAPAWSCAPDINAGSTCVLAIGNLAAGGSGSTTFAVTVANPVPAGFELVNNSASIADDGSNGIDPTPGNNTPSDDTPITALPVLDVSKTDGGVSTTAGGTVLWTIGYQNTGNQSASGVVLTETVPANTVFNAGASLPTLWTCANGSLPGTVCQTTVGTVVAGAAAAQVGFAVTVDSPLASGITQVANTVTIASDGSGGEGTDPQDSASDDTPIDAAPDLTLLKSDGGISSEPDGVIPYLLTYANVGTQDAINVVLSETVPANTVFNAGASSAGWSCADAAPAGTACTLAIGNVAAGAAPASVTFAITVDNPLPAKVLQIDNIASIADDGSNGVDPTPADNTAEDSTPVAAGPDLTLLKTDGGVTAVAGGTVVYTLTYENVGTQNATGVVITETVPDHVVFSTTGSTAGWSCADGDVAGTVCTFAVSGGVIAGAPPASVAFAIRLPATLPTGIETIANTASIADNGNNGVDPTPGNNTASDDTPIDAAPDLSIVKTDADVTAVPGGTVTYTLAYSNVGDQDADGVVLIEVVPANTVFVAAGSSPGWSCADGATAGITCTLVVGSLAAGDSGSATFVVRVIDAVPAGVEQLTNTVSIGDNGNSGEDPTPENNTDTEPTPLDAAPDLTVVKTAVQDVAVAGGSVVYQLTYSNVGGQGASNVTLTETVPANSRFAQAGSTAGWSCADGAVAGTVCTLNVGTVNAGAPAASVTFAIVVDSPLPAGADVLANTVVIGDDGNNGIDPTPGNNSSTDETPITAAPDMSILKTTSATQVKSDDVVPYTLTYRNIGARDATGVVITETVPVGTVFVAADSTAGWTCADGAVAGTICTLAVGDVAADGSSATAIFAVRVLSSADEAILNTASIADDGAGGTDPTPDNNVGTIDVVVRTLPPAVPSPQIIPSTDALGKLFLLLAMLSLGMLALRPRR